MNCHYDLSGNAFGDRCPECGWDVGNSVQSVEFYTRDYAIRAIFCACMAVLLALVPVLGMYLAHAAWGWQRGAAACCEDERVRSSQAWATWARIALIPAAAAGALNLAVTIYAVSWAVRWIMNH